jgi:exosome complex component RRP43
VQSHHVRPDGRAFSASRPVTISLGALSTAAGSALVRLGGTAVMCGVSALLAPPAATAPTAGFVVPNVHLPPMCSPSVRPGPPSEEAQRLSVLLQAVLVDSRVVDTDELVVAPGRLVWSLHVDCVCLSDDGSVADACVLAALAALKATRLPACTVDTQSGVVVRNAARDHPVRIHCEPMSVSFVMASQGTLLADPTREEELMCSSRITVITDEHGALRRVDASLPSQSGSALQTAVASAVSGLTEQRRTVLQAAFASISASSSSLSSSSLSSSSSSER